MARVNTLAPKRLRKKPPGVWPLLIALTVVTVSIVYRHSAAFTVDPSVYSPLLDVIAKGESNGNYNAYYGNAGNATTRFTEMSVNEVLAWQEEVIRKGGVSSAVGKYQIIRPTLAGLVQQLGIDGQKNFNEVLQDKMAIALLERRGAHAFLQKKITREQFAANLAQEWAALPKIQGPRPAESYYAGDGINKARVSIDELLQALAVLETQANT